MKDQDICYWCGEKATNKEHVPPKCLFPESKDISLYNDETFRNNLITVPSCDEHNLRKSNDDEYLMACLSGKVGNNGIAYIHSQTKVRRTLKRNPKLLKIDKDDVIKIKDREFPVQWVTIDNYRLRHSFEAIGRAIYFHEFNTIYKGECVIVSRLFLNSDNKKTYDHIINTTKLVESEQLNWGTEIKGNNKKIFTYQFSPIDSFKCQTLALTFYESIKVYIAISGMSQEEVEKYRKLFGIIE